MTRANIGKERISTGQGSQAAASAGGPLDGSQAAIDGVLGDPDGRPKVSRRRSNKSDQRLEAQVCPGRLCLDYLGQDSDVPFHAIEAVSDLGESLEGDRMVDHRGCRVRNMHP